MDREVAVRVPAWAERLVEYDDSPVCHGYQNACWCDRCTDRHERFKLFLSEGRPDPHGAAKRESEDRFKRPWLYRLDEEVGLHRPLRT